ncbi:carboxylating nicotinate-nucleotide diphosphorylase [Tahibacter sp.]|uniref:carboxylating nicotinate-nucleotide diphosphorylase n=1 Tax=Tahibacter sp. TaxID=2056211 RepID=UPI0028C37B27|nr:carboxylating nicotinate-nucleotide diphosphorylase [Tahibacter sp.]
MRFDPPDAALILADVRRALAEDLGPGDATADLLPAESMAQAYVITREAAVLCGQGWFEACFRELDPDMVITWHAADGDRLDPGQIFVEMRGNARALVSAERCALNFVQTLSATATVTAAHVAAVRATRTRILDTRKTLPGLRIAQKYAVRCGGGSNHRIGLFDAMLIKENHIAAAGSLSAAVRTARAYHPQLLLEVEVENFAELDEALIAGVDRVMLDEFSDADLGRAVAHVDGRAEIEVSGGVDLSRLKTIAASGVDFISVGALTKHVRAIDLSMRVKLKTS